MVAFRSDLYPNFRYESKHSTGTGLFPLTKKPELTHLNISVSLYLYILALTMQEGRGWYRGVCRAVPIRVAMRTDWTGRGLWDGGGRVEGLCLSVMVEVGGC